MSNIIQRGGTVLKSARCEEFLDPEGRKKAYENMVKHNIDALVVIGGDGTLTGAAVFAREFNIPVVGLPGTIDNDLLGTDVTIGYNTALNTIVEAVDKIRDTASSHERLFLYRSDGPQLWSLGSEQCYCSWCRGCYYSRDKYRERPIARIYFSGFQKKQKQ